MQFSKGDDGGEGGGAGTGATTVEDAAMKL
jgi:hypothetical protein